MTAPAPYQALATYLRLSRNPDGTLTSVRDQRKIMEREYARIGAHCTAWFADDDLSAWDETIARPEWELYLKALDSGQHDGAGSYHLDRLSRNGRDSEALISVAKRSGLDLITPGTVLKLGTNPEHQLMFRIWSAVAQNQSDATARRERDHKQVAREDGKLRYALGGNPPVGFRDGPGDWETDEAHAALLADIVARMLTGSDLAPAWRAATKDREIPLTNLAAKARGTKRTRVPITEKMVRAALQRPATYGKITDRDGKVMGQASLASPPPLDPDLYDQVRLIFKARERGGLLPADRFPLGPVLFCGKCGNQLAGGTLYYRGTKRPAYMCKNAHRLPSGKGYNTPCRGVSADAAQIHAEVAAALAAWAETSTRYAAASIQPGEFEAQLAEVEGQIARKRQQVKAVKLERLQAIQASDEYDELIEAGNAVVAMLQDQAAKIRAAQAQPAVPATVDWDTLAADRKRQLVKLAWGRITVAPGKGGPKPLPMIDRLTWG